MNEQELYSLIKEQQKQLESTQQTIRELQSRIKASEDFQSLLDDSLKDIKKMCSRNFYLGVIVLFAILVLLGSD